MWVVVRAGSLWVVVRTAVLGGSKVGWAVEGCVSEIIVCADLDAEHQDIDVDVVHLIL